MQNRVLGRRVAGEGDLHQHRGLVTGELGEVAGDGAGGLEVGRDQH